MEDQLESFLNKKKEPKYLLKTTLCESEGFFDGKRIFEGKFKKLKRFEILANRLFFSFF